MNFFIITNDITKKLILKFFYFFVVNGLFAQPIKEYKDDERPLKN